MLSRVLVVATELRKLLPAVHNSCLAQGRVIIVKTSSFALIGAAIRRSAKIPLFIILCMLQLKDIRHHTDDLGSAVDLTRNDNITLHRITALIAVTAFDAEHLSTRAVVFL